MPDSFHNHAQFHAVIDEQMVLGFYAQFYGGAFSVLLSRAYSVS
jgi:hypothetical protein